MKKLVAVLTAAACMAGHQSHAQDLAFDKGRVVVTAGYGVPNLTRVSLRMLYGDKLGYSVSGYGPILIKGEYGILKQLGVGAVIGFSKTSLSYTKSDDLSATQYKVFLKWSSLSIGARINYHFVTREKLDVYVGLGLGYNINTLTYSSNGPSNNEHIYPDYNPYLLYYGTTIGFRYYFTRNIGVYAEGGIDKWSLLQGGLSLKF